MTRAVVAASLAVTSLLALSCEKPARVVAPTQAPSTTAIETEPPPGPKPRAPFRERALAAARALGTLHGTPIDVSLGAVPALVVLVGSKEMPLVGLILSDDPARDEPTIERLPGFPRAARALFAKASKDELFLMLESVAALDQPAGARGVFRVWLSRAARTTNPSLDRARHLTRATDAADLAARVENGPPDIPGGVASGDALHEEAALAALVARRDLDRAIAAEGLDLVRQYQNELLAPPVHLARGAVAASPRSREIRAILRAAAQAKNCGHGWCTATTDDGVSHSVQLVQEGAARRVATIVTDRTAPTAPTSPRNGTVVEAARSVTATETALALFTEAGPARVVGEAPLTSSGGTVGVAAVGQELQLVVRDGGYWATHTLFTRTDDGPSPEVRFADFDGDGRTDVAIRIVTELGGRAIPIDRAFLTPRLVDPFELADAASAFAMLRKTTLDASVRAALEVPSRGATREQVCKLLSSIRAPADVARASLPGAPLVSYTEPGMLSFSLSSKHARDATAADVQSLRLPCENLVCEPTRPVCTWAMPPTLDYFWLAWENGRLRFSAIALYTGS